METWEKPPTTDGAWQGFILPIILGYLERHIYTSAVFTFVKAFLVSLQLMICQLLTPVLLRVDSGCLQGRHHLALGHQLRSPFCTLCLIVLCVHDSKETMFPFLLYHFGLCNSSHPSGSRTVMLRSTAAKWKLPTEFLLKDV
jgi:hypothetical protein